MDINSLKYFIENRSINVIQDERVKEDNQLKNYLIFKSLLPEYTCKTEQKIGKITRLTTKKINNQ